ncbi:hypothetical protein C8R45DRAFT_946677 [Mycena sanguinolenta]|nr:hypothetical protein C8R45DRAFT_946677 [Mycena sanguinolenta]
MRSFLAQAVCRVRIRYPPRHESDPHFASKVFIIICLEAEFASSTNITTAFMPIRQGSQGRRVNRRPLAPTPTCAVSFERIQPGTAMNVGDRRGRHPIFREKSKYRLPPPFQQNGETIRHVYQGLAEPMSPLGIICKRLEDSYESAPHLFDHLLIEPGEKSLVLPVIESRMCQRSVQMAGTASVMWAVHVCHGIDLPKTIQVAVLPEIKGPGSWELATNIPGRSEAKREVQEALKAELLRTFPQLSEWNAPLANIGVRSLKLGHCAETHPWLRQAAHLRRGAIVWSFAASIKELSKHAPNTKSFWKGFPSCKTERDIWNLFAGNNDGSSNVPELYRSSETISHPFRGENCGYRTLFAPNQSHRFAETAFDTDSEQVQQALIGGVLRANKEEVSGECYMRELVNMGQFLRYRYVLDPVRPLDKFARFNERFYCGCMGHNCALILREKIATSKDLTDSSGKFTTLERRAADLRKRVWVDRTGRSKRGRARMTCPAESNPSSASIGRKVYPTQRSDKANLARWPHPSNVLRLDLRVHSVPGVSSERLSQCNAEDELCWKPEMEADLLLNREQEFNEKRPKMEGCDGVASMMCKVACGG